MQIFDSATEHIKQGSRRRGANMGILLVDHPDILDFIDIKQTPGTLENFNLSVGVTDDFMEAVARGESYDLRHPSDGRVVGKLNAREVFDRLVTAAWATGDPGLLFLDAINRANPTPALGRIEATNPRGEVPLLPHESCNLGSINLARLIRNERDQPTFDWLRLGDVVQQAVRFLDDVITVNRYPLPEIEDMTRATRKIGLGITGFTEALLRLGIPYRSERAVSFAGEIMSSISAAARETSENLAAERGPFPGWTDSVFSAQGLRLRNATLTSIAPTGTISIIADTTSSIEPLFALSYRRVGVFDDQTLTEFNPVLLNVGEEQGWLTSDTVPNIETI